MPLLRNHRDDPTLERAGPIFVHGPNHPRDARSHKRQRRFLASVLGVASASRLDWIGRFDRLHAVTKGRRGTRNTSATRPQGISETLRKIPDRIRWSQNTGISTPDHRRTTSRFRRRASLIAARSRAVKTIVRTCRSNEAATARNPAQSTALTRIAKSKPTQSSLRFSAPLRPSLMSRRLAH
jgi:hypothetical protein